MRPCRSTAQVLCAILVVALQFTHALSPRTQIADSYDFVIVGGGQAGLVLGCRLSEDLNHTVLVLESGGNGDDYRERIGAQPLCLLPLRELIEGPNIRKDTPAYAYFDSLWTTPLNWAFNTFPQPNANNREIFWPRGKVLGGSYLRHIHKKRI